MTELPDDELDKLFRKSSEEFDPTYEPEDWNALRKRLDRHDGKTPLYWLKKWWPLALLALIVPAGLGYYLLHNSDEQPLTFSDTRVTKYHSTNPASGSERKVGSNEIKSDLADKKEQEHKQSGDSNKAERGTSIITTESENKIDEGTGETIKEKKYNPGLRKTKVYAEVSAVKSEKTTSLPKNFKGIAQAEEQQLTKQIVSEKANTNASDKILPGTTDINSISVKEETSIVSEKPEITLLVSPIPNLPFIPNESLPLPAIAVPQNDIQSAEIPSRDLSPKLAVRFGYSPDMTTVGLKNFSKPGSAVSLMLEYSLLQKLYLQTGVVRSVKDYRAGADEYALNKYVTNINTPYSVDGLCTMIEIPVGLRYDLVQKPRSRWFVGAGVSSYYVQKEKYTYYYEQYVHGQMPGWKGKTGWFWLSHLNASAGYEYRISNKLSLVAEPYIQLPLKGVGYGKVNLITTGMWLSVRYTPFFNR